MSLDSVSIGFSNESEYENDELTFHNACAEGNLSMVKVYLAQQGFDMNMCVHFDGRTGFHWACRNGNLNVVQFLLQKGFDMNICNNQARTGFHEACRHGNLNVVQFLLQKGFDVNAVDFNGNTGFYHACLCGKLNVVRFLVQRGFDINVGDIWGINGILGNNGFDYACMSGHLNVVQFFVQKGYDINAGNDDGATGFHYACFNGHFNVVQFFIQQGFEGINKLNFEGETGLGILIAEEYHDFSDNELYMPCLLLLIEAGAQLIQSAHLFEKLISAIQNRIFEITFMKEIIFEKWTGRIAQAITDFTIVPFTSTSLQNLSQVLD